MIPESSFIRRFGLYFMISILFLAIACGDSSRTDQSTNDPVLATLYGKELRLSQLEGFQKGQDPKDSLAEIQNLRDQWIKESLWIHQAEKAINSSDQIDSLLAVYKQSLILDQYQNQFIDHNLDPQIDDKMIQSYYDEHEKEFNLTSDILAVDLIRFPASASLKGHKILSLNYSVLNAGQQAEFDEKVIQLDGQYLLKKSGWITADDLRTILPKANPDGQINKPNFLSDQGYQYMLRIDQKLKAGGTAPLSFVEDQIKLILTRQKIKKLLQDEQTRLYQEAMDQKLIHIY